MSPMSPNLIQPNVACRIRSVDANGGARLTQMGILPGVELQIVRVSPFGGRTVEVMIGGSDIVALRSEEIISMECDLVAMPLSSPAVGPGSYRVVTLAGGAGFRNRMAERGLIEGAIVDVTRTSPLVVEVNDTRVRLGRGEADKVVVEETIDDQP